MVYITASGSISQEVRFVSNPKEYLRRKIFCKNGIAIAVVAIAILIRFKNSNPFANGVVPAARRSPDQHWSHMSKDASFIRTMTEPLVGKSKAATQVGKDALKSADLTLFLDRADFGGADGHVAEASGEMDMEQLRVTRCSTTRSGVAAYFCGAEVATNQDAALGFEGKGQHHGTRSFREHLKCRHDQGLQTGTMKRSVYRLGIGCRDHLAGMSHAWSIVAQPGGTFFWLQSYISQYSLSTWLKKADDTKESGFAGHLTLAELIGKLDAIDRLMKIDGWTEEANADYYDLFNVDKNYEAAKGGLGRPRKEWEPADRLVQFSWDEACEYPLPVPDAPQNTNEEMGKERPVDSSGDQCDIMLRTSSLANLLGVKSADGMAGLDIEAIVEKIADGMDGLGIEAMLKTIERNSQKEKLF